MFGHIGNIFTHKPRHAETLDTRQGIRRHDPDHESSRRKKKEAQERFVIDEDDRTVVSIDALQAFLEHFLQTQIVEEKSQGTLDTSNIQTPKQALQTSDEHTGSMASVAANAYQNTALTSQGSQSTFNAQPDNSYLGGADIRVIHELLDDLKDLSAKGVEYLDIERSESFLGSLTAAVEKLK